MSCVTTRRLDGIAVIEIDNPPVNATSQAVRQGLRDAVLAAGADAQIVAMAIVAAGRTFTAGGDISEFDQPPREPHLPDVLDLIEASDKPVVVAWHGTALGGGCEIGLAAHARIIASHGKVGLPEVKLGLLPGAGGTQRLPRLIGPIAALDLVTSGRAVGSREALELGLVDAIAKDDLLEEALELLRGRIGIEPRRTSRLAIEPPASADWQAVTEKVKREARGRIAPVQAIALIEQAMVRPFGETQPVERRTFFELMRSEQSKALRHLFWAERESGKLRELAGVDPLQLERIGVVGGGTMGSGIATAFLDAGYRVTLLEAAQPALDAGVARIEALYDRALRSERINTAERQERLSRLTPTVDLSTLSTSGLVVEAVFENMDVKLDLLKRLAATVSPAALIATNTSYLDIEFMADILPDPSRFLGLHFFSPAHVMRLLEVVRGRRTSLSTLATAVALGRKLQKVVVVSGVCDGFIGNRILARYRAQCEFMLEEGALPQQIDAAMEAFGMAMGPFAVQDLAGLDIAWARRKRLAPSLTADVRNVPLLDHLCEAGRFGQKAGRGWYRYDNGRRVPDPEVETLVRAHATESGRVRSPMSAETIQGRVIGAIVNEGLKILDEGIAARPFEIDLVLVNGYGFPAWRGGPMFHADRIGLDRVLKVARISAIRDGRGFEVSSLLENLVAAGRDIDSLNR